MALFGSSGNNAYVDKQNLTHVARNPNCPLTLNLNLGAPFSGTMVHTLQFLLTLANLLSACIPGCEWPGHQIFHSKRPITRNTGRAMRDDHRMPPPSPLFLAFED